MPVRCSTFRVAVMPRPKMDWTAVMQIRSMPGTVGDRLPMHKHQQHWLVNMNYIIPSVSSKAQGSLAGELLLKLQLPGSGAPERLVVQQELHTPCGAAQLPGCHTLGLMTPLLACPRNNKTAEHAVCVLCDCVFSWQQAQQQLLDRYISQPGMRPSLMSATTM